MKVDLRTKVFHNDGHATFEHKVIKYQGSMAAIQRAKKLNDLLSKRDGNKRLVIFQSLPY
jgi:hypothetical protein